MSLKDIIENSGGRIELIEVHVPKSQSDTYKSQSARDAQAANYGNRSYWDYLEKKAIEYDELDRSLSEALQGNDGN